MNFLAVHSNVARCVNPDPHPVTFGSDNDHSNVVSNDDRFADLSTEHEHKHLPPLENPLSRNASTLRTKQVEKSLNGKLGKPASAGIGLTYWETNPRE
jgi:hypothetical protein